MCPVPGLAHARRHAFRGQAARTLRRRRWKRVQGDPCATIGAGASRSTTRPESSELDRRRPRLQAAEARNPGASLAPPVGPPVVEMIGFRVHQRGLPEPAAHA